MATKTRVYLNKQMTITGYALRQYGEDWEKSYRLTNKQADSNETLTAVKRAEKFIYWMHKMNTS